MVPSPQFNKLWLQINLKEAWEPTLPNAYYPETLGPQTLAALRDIRLTIMRAEKNAAATPAVASTVGTNTNSSERARAAAAAITAMRGGRTTAIVPPMGKTAGAAAKKSADAKKEKSPPTPST